jgi:cysteine-rich repeat protein
MRRSLLLLALAACAPTVSPSDLPVGVAPPPVHPELGLEVSAVQAGTTAAFRVDGLNPGESVYILRSGSTASPGLCPPVTGGMCLELRGPVAVVGTAIANSQGEATLQLTLPAAVPAGLSVVFQAAAIRGPGGAHSVRSPAIRRVTSQAPPASVYDLVPGDLVLTELLPDPTAVPDAVGEWFELANLAGVSVDLAGLEVTSGGERFVIPSALVVGPGGRVVLGASEDPSLNGGVPVDLAWTGLTLDDADDLALSGPTGLLDAVSWDGGPAFPAPAGETISLDPRHTTATDNDDGAVWCPSPGTPGLDNDLCPLPFCGDGAVDPGEACDDGGTAPGDGCDDECQLEGCPVMGVPTGTWLLSQPGYPSVRAAEGPDGDLFIVGRGWGSYGMTTWLSRVDGASLAAEWATEWSNYSPVETLPTLVPLADGTVTVLATLLTTPHSVAMVSRFDAAGALLGDRQLYETPSHDDHLAYDLAPTADGGYLMVGQSDAWSAMMVRLDADLDYVWNRPRHLNPPHNPYNAFHRAEELPDGTLLMMGRPDWLHKSNAAGTNLWSRVTNDATVLFRDLAVGADLGSFVIAQDTNHDAHLLRHDTNGALVWSRKLVPPPGHAAAWSETAFHLDVTPATCDGAVLDGDVCAVPGDRCATATTLCACDVGSTWTCEPGAQSVVLGWRVTGPTLSGATLTLVDGAGAAVNTVLLDPTPDLHDLWVGPQGDVNAFLGGERLVRLDEGLGGACNPTPLPDVRLDPSSLTSRTEATQQWGGFPAFTIRQSSANPLITPYPAPTATLVCEGVSCP